MTSKLEPLSITDKEVFFTCGLDYQWWCTATHLLFGFVVLFKGAFPGNLQLVLVLRPSRFFQRTIADIGIRLHKDDFKMKVKYESFLLSKKSLTSINEPTICTSVFKCYSRTAYHNSFMLKPGELCCVKFADCDAELFVRPSWLCGQRSTDPGVGRKFGVLSQSVDPPPNRENAWTTSSQRLWSSDITDHSKNPIDPIFFFPRRP